MKIEASGIGDLALTGNQRTARLIDGAHQFEAMMLEQMLKPLNFAGTPDDTGGEALAGAGGTIQGFGTEALSKAIVKGGGLGLARQMIRQITAEDAAHRGSKAVPAEGAKV